MRQNGSAPLVALALVLVLALAAWSVFAPDAADPVLESGTAESEVMQEAQPAGVADSDPSPELQAMPEAEPVEEAKRTAAETEIERAVRVRAIDENGDPVPGLVVAVGMRVPGGSSATRLASGVTDEEGRAALKLDHDKRKRYAAFPPNPELMIDARFASSERVRVKKLMEQAETEETVLELPAIRRLQIRVVHADGRLVDTPGWASMEWAPAGTPSDSRLWVNRRAESVPLENGLAQFVCGVDQDLRVSVGESSGRFEGGYANFAGPTLADPPLVEREIALGPQHARVVGRLVNEDGEPLALERMAFHHTHTLRAGADWPRGNPDRKWVRNFDLDAEGRFDFALITNDWTRRHDRSWTFVLTSNDRSTSLPRIDEVGAKQVQFDVPRDPEPGSVFDAGDLVVREMAWPLLVSGQVLEPDSSRGAAVISVMTTEKNWQDRKRLWRGQPERDGSFEVYAEPPANGEILVSAGGFGNLGVEERVPVGTTNLVLEMVKGTTLHGRLYLSDGLPWHEMSIRMPGGRSKEIMPNGSFTVDYLRPSSDSWVSLEHNGRELWRSSPIVISEAGDPQFRPIQVQDVDLRGKHRLWQFKVLAPDGSPFAENTHTRANTATEGNTVYLDAASNWLQVLPVEVERVQFQSSGYEAVELSWPPPESITLRKSVR